VITSKEMILKLVEALLEDVEVDLEPQPIDDSEDVDRAIRDLGYSIAPTIKKDLQTILLDLTISLSSGEVPYWAEGGLNSGYFTYQHKILSEPYKVHYRVNYVTGLVLLTFFGPLNQSYRSGNQQSAKPSIPDSTQRIPDDPGVIILFYRENSPRPALDFWYKKSETGLKKETRVAINLLSQKGDELKYPAMNGIRGEFKELRFKWNNNHYRVNYKLYSFGGQDEHGNSIETHYAVIFQGYIRQSNEEQNAEINTTLKMISTLERNFWGHVTKTYDW
jgi:hypothetical protein